MKKCFYYMLGAVLLALVFSLTSCSLEEPTIDPIFTNEDALTATSNELSIIQRTANNDGSWDNIVDGSSCLSVIFPYTVSVNGVELIIESVEDLQKIEDIFDASNIDEDFLDLFFPISITLADYSEIVINNKDELQKLVAECIEGGADEDIECIDFIYPLTMFTFNTDFVQTAAVIVSSDSELRRFFTGLGENDLVGINYPISLELYDGTKITVNDNAALISALEMAIDACDEDDDNDYGDDDFSSEELQALLTECPWLLNNLIRSEEYTSLDFVNYILDFNVDGSVIAQDLAGIPIPGKWEVQLEDNRVQIILDFELLAVFNLTWNVDDIANERIKLFTTDEDTIILEKYCDFEPVACTETFIRENLSDCTWIPAQEANSFLDDLTIDFSNMNIHVYNPNDEVVDEGNWAVEGTIVVFNNLSAELANYIGEWEVIECSAVRFKLKRGEEYLVLEKKCD